MAQKRKITPELEGEVLQLSAQRWSDARIAKRLEAHGVRISGRQVNEFVRSQRKARAPIANEIVRAHVEATLPGDLEVFDGRIKALRVVVERL